jgi:ESCRT-I complex subunit TSG101
LCLHGTVACQYQGNRYNIPIEIWFQQDHPVVPPLVYVKPTSDMYVSPRSKDVLLDGTVIIPYLKNWHHVKHKFCFFAILFHLIFSHRVV